MIRPISRPTRSRGIRKSTLAWMAACFLLVAYIGFLLASNYRTQIALRESTMKRLQLDLEKRAASIGYYFSERRNDLQSMATSREIASYFINKSLGMSETYGLKANLFIINQLFDDVIRRKTIQEDPIYRRILFTDEAGRILAEASNIEIGEGKKNVRSDALSTDSDSSVVVFEAGSEFWILLTVPCMYQDRTAGKLVAFLNTEAILTHFVNYSTEIFHTAFYLVTPEGDLISSHSGFSRPAFENSEPPLSEAADRAGTPSHLFDTNRLNSEPLFLGEASIHNSPLTLRASVKSRGVEFAQSPWQLLWGTGSLAVIILAGVWILLRFNARKLILQASFEESERQQELLAQKNRQLKDEISLRLRAEEELEKQRTLQMHSDRLRSLGEMAAGIAHELNQPLVGVRGVAEILLLILESRSSLEPEKTAERLRTILQQADRMVHIIDHVRRFAREAGHQETRPADLNDIVRSSVDLLKTQFQSRGILLNLRIYPHVLPVQVNPFSVEEVILNLLTNGRDALEQRRQTEGPRFVPQVTLTTWKEASEAANQVQLEVRDNGTGIPEDISSRLFVPFFTTKDPDKGTGLGLSICKSIVEGFDGRIDFSSTEGEGTAFILSFPEDKQDKRSCG